MEQKICNSNAQGNGTFLRTRGRMRVMKTPERKEKEIEDTEEKLLLTTSFTPHVFVTLVPASGDQKIHRASKKNRHVSVGGPCGGFPDVPTHLPR
jgi:hypothetical protein